MVEKTLRRWRGQRPQNLETTLDLDVQRAAEQALGTTKKKAALVALQPSTGDVLAVANRPSDSTLDRALTGLYPPGSTFKVITHRGAAARRPLGRPDRAVPGDQGRRRPLVPQLRGRCRRRGAVPHRLRPVVQHRVRLARGPAEPLGADRHGAGLRRRRAAQARPARGRRPGAGGRDARRARGDDDRPGQDRREPADHGRRGRNRRRGPLARAAAAGRRSASDRSQAPRTARRRRCAS